MHPLNRSVILSLLSNYRKQYDLQQNDMHTQTTFQRCLCSKYFKSQEICCCGDTTHTIIDEQFYADKILLQPE